MQRASASSTVKVKNLLEHPELQLNAIAGTEGLGRIVGVPRIQRPGLALAGYTPAVQLDRVQLFGYSEVAYIRTLDAPTLQQRMNALCGLGPACLVFTRALEVPDEVLAAGNSFRIPVLRTALMTSVFTMRVSQFLTSHMSAWTHLHGVMVDAFGVGVLLIGKSGIGKSEAALDLVLRGHRFVADDMVEVRHHAPEMVVGSAAPLIRHHVEIRGLGIIDIKELFGSASVRDAKKIELVIELVEWNSQETYDRVGIEELFWPILGVEVPLLRIPVHPGRSVSTLIEVAARNFLLKRRGVDSARRFEEKLSKAIRDSGPLPLTAAAEPSAGVE